MQRKVTLLIPAVMVSASSQIPMKSAMLIRMQARLRGPNGRFMSAAAAAVMAAAAAPALLHHLLRRRSRRHRIGK